eukprot:comp20831_c0_seq1/m.43138 comp20831_c0_seq1/g.43138  ORF comp20831_c0_seq1/g.43138 comp20831_c0_seq1/m.43138 type:complete len:387 (+) comp20831_c0_seq1:182-1342(+)
MAFAYSGETEIDMGRIFQIGKDVKKSNNSDISPSQAERRVVSVSSLGKLGRFGNQIFQYSFVKQVGRVNNASVVVPSWIGAFLFENADEISEEISARKAMEKDTSQANSIFDDLVLQQIKDSNNGTAIPVAGPQDLTEKNEKLVGTDIWGWFQINMSAYPDKENWRSLFRPRKHLKEKMDEAMAKLREKGNTVIGVHIRRGDYTSIAMTSFGYSVPTAWYITWLNSIWHTLDKPVLFVATDDPTGAVVRDFDQFHPETLATLGATMPEDMRHLKADFYPDFYILSQCDMLAISNSTFSFAAALMNERPNTVFLRPHADLGLIAFDPWTSQPILHRDMNKDVLSNLRDTVMLVHKTEGLSGCMRLFVKEFPLYLVRKAILFCTIGAQ